MKLKERCLATLTLASALSAAAFGLFAASASAHLEERAPTTPTPLVPPATTLNSGACGSVNPATGQTPQPTLARIPARAADPNDPNAVVCQTPPPPTPAPPGPLSGKVIAFTSAVDLSLADGNGIRGGIYVTAADGSAPRKIIQYQTYLRSPVAHTFQEPDDHPTISPDGTRIAWTSSRADPTQDILGSTKWDIWVANINGTSMQQLTFGEGALDTQPTWSPDGQTIYFARGTDPFFGNGDLDIYRMNADGSNQQQVTSGSLDDFEPNVSPDGTRLAFTRDMGGGNYEIHVMNLATGAISRLTFNDSEDHDPDWSGGGGRLFITSEEGNIKQPYGDVYEINSTTGAVEDRVTDFPLLSRGDPSVSADGLVVAAMEPLTPIARAPHVIDVFDGNGNNLGHTGGPGLVDIHPSIGVTANVNGGLPDYLESGSVGEPLVQVPGRVRAGKRFQVSFGWEHPQAWRQLDTIELFLTLHGRPVGSLRLLIDTLELSAWENGLGGYGLSYAAGKHKVLRSGGLRLDLGHSEVINTSTQTITANLALSVTKQLAGHGYGISVQAEDLDGGHQGERLGGKHIRVTD